MDADHPERNDDIEMLVELLDRYGMRIEGTTPIFFNGPYGRPFEVRTWLQRRARVKRFVILDDESFLAVELVVRLLHLYGASGGEKKV